MLKTTHSFSLILPILITFSLAIQFIPGTASAEVYKTDSFTLSLPLGWSLTQGVEPMSHVFPVNNVFREDVVTNGDGSADTLANAPVKKDGGEMAVFGRNDRKAAFIIISGPFEPGNFKALAEKCAQQPGMEKISETENQAMLKIANNGHDEYTLLRQDETQTHLLIIKFSGELSEMRFLSTGMTSPFKGLVPELK